MKYLFFISSISLVLLFHASCGNKTESKKTELKTDSVANPLTGINARIRTNPNSADLYQERARYYMTKKDFGSALADIVHGLNIDSNRAEYYLTLADIYFMTNKTGASRMALDKCQSLDPKNIDCTMKLAELYFYVKQYQKSLDFLDKVLKLDPYNAKAYFLKGMNFKEGGDTSKAISSMQTAVEQDNSYYNAYVQLGLLCAAQHNKIAENYYDNALRIQPNSPEALYDFGRLYQEEGNFVKATEMYQRILAQNKDVLDAQYNLGVIKIAEKAFPEAMKYFSEVIRIDPKNPKGYYGRGYCYQMKKDVQNASADYKYTLTLDPDFELAKKGLKEIKTY
jgi:tetratricopeptide (TPR) repeat protein